MLAIANGKSDNTQLCELTNLDLLTHLEPGKAETGTLS